MGALRKVEQSQPRTGEVISIVPILEQRSKSKLSSVHSLQYRVFEFRRNVEFSKLGRDTAFVIKGTVYTAIVAVACACLLGGLSLGSDSATAGQLSSAPKPAPR